MEPSLIVKNFDFTYHHSNSKTLECVQLQLPSKGCIAFLGHNGSGKTTLLKLLSGLMTEREGVLSGELSYQNKSLLKISDRERVKTICYLGADHTMGFSITVRDALEFGFYADSKIQTEKISEVSKLLKLETLMSRDVRKLSGGERQRVLLARGLIVDSRILVLDETLSKMDLENQIEVGELLKKIGQQKLILWVGHDLNFSLKWADELVLLKNGKVIKSGPAEEVGIPENLNKLFSGPSIHWTKDPISNRYQVGYQFTCK